MKFNLKLLLAGSLTAIAVVFAPFALKAQDIVPNRATQAQSQAQSQAQLPQAQPTQPQTQPVPLSVIIERLNLTADQQAQLNQLQLDTRAQLENIVSVAQRQQFFDAMRAGRPFQDAIAAANLSADQQAQVRSVLRTSQQTAMQILTPEQQQQVRQFVQERFREGGSYRRSGANGQPGLNRQSRVRNFRVR